MLLCCALEAGECESPVFFFPLSLNPETVCKKHPKMRVLTLAILALVAVCVVATRDVPAMWRPHNAKVNRADVIGITVALKRRNVDKLDRIFWDVSDPNSPRYGEHLNNEQMRELVSPGRAVVERVVSWLKENGALEVKVSNHEDEMTARFRLSSLESMLDVKFENFVHAQSGRVIARAMKAPNIPADIAPHIDVLSGLSGFPIEHGPRIKRLNSQAREAMNVTPEVLFRQYNVTEMPPESKLKNIVAFFQAQGEYTSAKDLVTFCARYTNISNESCVVTKYINGNNDNSPGEESSLDSEYLMALANGLEMWVFTYPQSDFCNDLMSWTADVFSNTNGSFPSVISISYGVQVLPNWCLPERHRITESIQKMGAMGITVLASSGDDGSGETARRGYNYGLLGASFPSTIPYVTSVGGTTFVSGNSGEEMATKEFGSGGGFTFDWPAPEFQKSFIDEFFRNQPHLPPPYSYNRSCRGTPDVSALAEEYQVISGGYWSGIGGTSASCPMFAGMVGLLNNVRLLNNKTLGYINPLLYAHSDAFVDIVKGDNDDKKIDYGWYCAKGWDPATGLGTPNFGKLLEIVRAINARETKMKRN